MPTKTKWDFLQIGKPIPSGNLLTSRRPSRATCLKPPPKAEHRYLAKLPCVRTKYKNGGVTLRAPASLWVTEASLTKTAKGSNFRGPLRRLVPLRDVDTELRRAIDNPNVPSLIAASSTLCCSQFVRTTGNYWNASKYRGSTRFKEMSDPGFRPGYDPKIGSPTASSFLCRQGFYQECRNSPCGVHSEAGVAR